MKVEAKDATMNPFLKAACAAETRTFCPDVPAGEARLMSCLKSFSTRDSFGKACTEELKRFPDVKVSREKDTIIGPRKNDYASRSHNGTQTKAPKLPASYPNNILTSKPFGVTKAMSPSQPAANENLWLWVAFVAGGIVAVALFQCYIKVRSSVVFEWFNR